MSDPSLWLVISKISFSLFFSGLNSRFILGSFLKLSGIAEGIGRGEHRGGE
jgi:hypothetical protein